MCASRSPRGNPRSTRSPRIEVARHLAVVGFLLASVAVAETLEPTGLKYDFENVEEGWGEKLPSGVNDLELPGTVQHHHPRLSINSWLAQRLTNKPIVMSTISSNGRITVPKAIRDHLNLKPGDRVKFFVHPDGHVVLLPTLPVSALRGLLRPLGRPATIEEMDKAIAEQAAQGCPPRD
jgi:antitoxin PrlF